jgi:serine phosphatase RsbU (regulator of sigma subunit)
MRLATKELPFGPGSRLMASTDGAYEFLNPRKQQFGIRGLTREFAKTSTMSLQEALKAIESAIEIESQNAIEDDRTMILVERI